MPDDSQTSDPPQALLLIGKPELAGLEVVQGLHRRLEAAGYRPTEVLLGEWLKARAKPQAELVVAAGGDGTVRHAATAAYESGARLMVLPLGTANDLARTLGVPLRPERAAELLETGCWRRIDLGRCNGLIFCNVASFGLSSSVAQRLTSERKKKWGPLAYARQMLDSARASRHLRVRLELDGEHYRYRALQVGIASGETQGGGNRVAADASIDDGKLRVYVIEPQPLPRLMVMALSVKLGAYDLWEGAHFYEAEHVRVTTRGGHKVNVDGDLLTRTPVEAEILPGAIEVLVPPETVKKADETE
jgi:YegS/Rv2252/BmrU family lipid kinase